MLPIIKYLKTRIGSSFVLAVLLVGTFAVVPLLYCLLGVRGDVLAFLGSLIVPRRQSAR